MKNANSKPASDRWFPTVTQLSDPAAVERSFRQILTQHYELQDRFAELHATMTKAAGPAAAPGPEAREGPAPGPATQQLLGLPVGPIDVNSLANGATLRYDKTRRMFIFS